VSGTRPSLVYLAVGVLSWPLVRYLFRLRPTGLEHLPRGGGYVLAANHTSNFDPWPLGLPLFPRRYLRFMAKAELYWWPLRHLLDAGGAFRVRRGLSDAEAVETAVELVRGGEVVVVFPEGTRQRKGLVKRFEARPHTGAARIALEAGAPLVPAAITGTDRLTRLGPLRVAYGSPIELDDLRGADPFEAAQTATDRLMAEIRRLQGTLRGSEA
jgi:1-acyl-sn-glycerol-3-phosphate acyltransferase